jgi:hypothetical protein
VLGRYWIRNVETHGRGNFALGFGVKAPTGDYDATDIYPGLNGQSPTRKAVDQSIQPGDGGWGIILDFQGFKRIGKTVLLGSGTYLANPRDTNGTPSIIAGLGLAANPAFRDKVINSVPDQYVVRLGAAYPFGQSGIFAGGWIRAEGLPRYDLIGQSHGFRRPGYEIFFEPNLSYSRGPDTWSLSVPLALYRDRAPDPYTGQKGDATFPDAIVLVGYAHRFGGAQSPPQAARAVPGSACDTDALAPSPEGPGGRVLESSR